MVSPGHSFECLAVAGDYIQNGAKPKQKAGAKSRITMKYFPNPTGFAPECGFAALVPQRGTVLPRGTPEMIRSEQSHADRTGEVVDIAARRTHGPRNLQRDDTWRAGRSS